MIRVGDAVSDFPPSSDGRPDARPLYAQVESILNARIAAGEWQPGHALPSEPELAQELGVSHGTVRKALDALAPVKAGRPKKK